LDNNILDKIITEIEIGNFRNAITYCDDLLNEFPDNRSVYEIRSGCYYAIGDYESAISDLTYSIVKLKSGEDSIDEIIVLYSKRGKIYLKKSDWKKAAEDYKKILLLNQNIPEIQNSLAVCYRKTENYIEALYHASQAIKLNDEFAEAYNNRANINISLEKFKEAIDDYTKSLELNPLSANVYFNRGSIYYDILNDKEKALQDFEKAISLKQDLKEEINKHYSDLFEVPVNKPEVNEVVIHEETKPELPPEIITPAKEDTSIGFSLDEFDSLFKGNKTESVVTPVQDTNKSDDIKSPDFSSLFDKIENDKAETVSPKVTEVNKSDDIVIPSFDLKSMFAELNQNEEVLPQEEEPLFRNKPVISEDVKLLHEEIQSVKEEDLSGDMGGINFDAMSNFKNKEIPAEKEEDLSGNIGGRSFDAMSNFKKKETANDNIPESEPLTYAQEEKKSFLRSPVFFIILISLMGIIILLSVLKFFKTQENQIVNTPTEVKIDSTVVKKADTLNDVTKDTIARQEPETKVSETKTEEVRKEETKKEEPLKKNTELTTKNLGFISDKKQFVLFSEPDGYYVQIGSYKEKSKADEKLRLLEKNNVKGKVFEIDLKEKGIFFRVRAGVFATPEEAKEKTIRIE
jgi:tetratricopeptide (TPR) repeat protein